MKKPYLSRSESIILSALEIISELGISGLSTREIARRQNISDAALYKHFKSKEEIVLEVLNYYSKFDTALMKTVRNNNMSPAEGIVFFIARICENFEAYPPLTAIILLNELILADTLSSKKASGIMNDRENFLITLIEEGQAEGQISKFILPEEMAALIAGMFKNIVFKWRISGFSFLLKENVISVLKKLLKLCSLVENKTL